MQGLWQKHIFICENVREEGHPRPSCGRAGSLALRDWFKASLQKHQLHLDIRANKAGCLEACEAGPAVVIYPEGIWYRVATKDDVEQIVAEHLVAGSVVKRLVMDFSQLPICQTRAKRNGKN